MMLPTEDAPLKEARAAPASPDPWADEEEDYPEYKKPVAPMGLREVPASGGLFKEVNAMRKDKSEATEGPKLKDSALGRLAASNKFMNLTFAFIGANALYIGLDADYSARTGKPDDLWDADTPIGFVMMENVFCIYFTGEVVIRFLAYQFKTDCFTDAWFVFDGVLVSLMVLETWFFPFLCAIDAFCMAGGLSSLSVLRLLRLLRISRMARLMKKVPELMIIIKGLIASFRSVGCTAILQILILYVWSILFVSEYHEKEDLVDDPAIESYFGTMGKSMFSLFIYGTVLDDVTAATNAIRGTDNFFMLSLFIVFILISSFTILNMLIGILCEVVSATADSEQTKAAETTVKDAITTLFNKMDVDGSGNITEEEFMHMRDDETVRSALEEMDIYESHFQRYCEILFHQDDACEEDYGDEAEDQKAATPKEVKPKEEPSINFETLITMILRLSPGNHINALDFSLLQASIDRTQETLRERVLKIHDLIQEAVTSSGEAAQPPPPGFSTGGATAALADTRKAALGDSPPPPPSPGAPASATSSAQVETKEFTLDMFTRTSSHTIIEELERRLGVSALEARKMPTSPKVLQAQKAGSPMEQSQEAFHSLGVPEE